MLKLKQLGQGEEWRGKVTYKDTEVEVSDPTEVEGEINKGMHMPTLAPHSGQAVDRESPGLFTLSNFWAFPHWEPSCTWAHGF